MVYKINTYSWGCMNTIWHSIPLPTAECQTTPHPHRITGEQQCELWHETKYWADILQSSDTGLKNRCTIGQYITYLHISKKHLTQGRSVLQHSYWILTIVESNFNVSQFFPHFNIQFHCILSTVLFTTKHVNVTHNIKPFI